MTNEAKKTLLAATENTNAAATENPDAEPSINSDFDLKNLRLNQNFIETAGVKKLLTTVPVRKPGPQDFVRVHPHPDYRADVALLELRDDHEVYLLIPAMAQELPGEFFMATLFTAFKSAECSFPLAGQNAGARWPAVGLASVGCPGR